MKRSWILALVLPAYAAYGADDVATYLNNRKRRELSRLEDENKISVQVLGVEGVSPEHLVIECHDSQGREVKIPMS